MGVKKRGIFGASKYDEKSCGVVLFREEKGEPQYLLLHYPGGHWDFPKGHVEVGDKDEHSTALRELLEETGIADVTFIDGYREEIDYKFKNHKGQQVYKLVVFFLAKTELKEVKVSHEHHDSIWLPFDAAYNKVTFDNAKQLLKRAKEILSNAS